MRQLAPTISTMRRTANSNKCRRRRSPTNSSFLAKFSLSSQIIFSMFYIFMTSKTASSLYQKERCEYKSVNYSLEWAHEPLTQHIVFVLKAKLPEHRSQHEYYWTGVGFSTAKTELIRQFIGIRTNRESLDVLQINSDESRLNFDQADKSSNIHTISTNFDEKSHAIVAKFSRPVKSNRFEHNFELKGCVTFNVPTEMISADIINSKNLPKLMKRFEVCDVKNQCTIDVRFLNNSQKLTPSPQSKDFKNSSEKKLKDVGTKEGVELAHSVDVSGMGDPCGFIGAGYMVNWTYNKKSDCVDFVMRHPVKPGKWWSAVGIGDTMADMDIGVVFLDDGVPKKIIDYYSSSYTVPDKDSHQDWILHTSKSKIVQDSLGGTSEKQKMAVTYFSRQISTSDTEKDRTMDGCVLFQLAANSAHWGGNFALRKHEDWPDLYKACDLKRKCASDHHIEHSNDGNVENDENIPEEVEDVGESVDDNNANITSDNLAEEIGRASAVKGNVAEAEIEAETSDDQTAAAILTHNNSTIPESEEMDAGERIIISDNTTMTTAAFNEMINGTHGDDENNGRRDKDYPKSTSLPSSTILTLTGEFTTFATDIESDPTNTSTHIAVNDRRATNDPIAAILLAGVNNESRIEDTKLISEDLALANNSSDSPSIAITTSKVTTTTTPTAPLTTNLKEPDTTRPSVSTLEKMTDIIEKITTPLNITAKPSSTSTPTTTTASTTSTTQIVTTENTIHQTNSTSPATVKNNMNTTRTETPTSLLTTSIHRTKTAPTTTTESISKNEVSSLAVKPTKNKKIKKPLEKCEPSKSDLDICAGYMDNYFGQVKQWADKHSEKMENQYEKACRLLHAVPHVPTLCCKVFQDKCVEHI